MDEQLWQVFSTTGRVEDYLRYRGVTLPMSVLTEDDAYGGNKTASHDRRSDCAGISHGGGI